MTIVVEMNCPHCGVALGITLDSHCKFDSLSCPECGVDMAKEVKDRLAIRPDDVFVEGKMYNSVYNPKYED